jgi:hypothetical protein
MIEAKPFRTFIRIYSRFKSERLSANIKLNHLNAPINAGQEEMKNSQENTGATKEKIKTKMDTSMKTVKGRLEATIKTGQEKMRVEIRTVLKKRRGLS